MSFHSSKYIVSIFHNVLLSNEQSMNNSNNDTLPYISEENQNEGYLFLLVFDLIIFVL